MRKYFFYAFILALPAIFCHPVAAETSATPTATVSSSAARINTTDLTTQIRQARELAKPTLIQQRKAVQEKIRTIRDEKKRVLVDRIDSKIVNVNRMRTEEMAKALAALQAALDKLNGRINEASASGRDIASASAAYNKAKISIQTAQTAVASQAARTYTIEVVDESNLKQTTGGVVSKLQADLQATHKTVVDAKQAIALLAREVARIGRPVTISTTPKLTNGQPK